MKPAQAESVELTIEDLGVQGEGIGKVKGFTLFVEGALPGERVLASVEEVKATYGRARLEKILISSAHRVQPVCPLFGRCGGCQLMHMSYPQQLKMKTKRVADTLKRIGQIEVEVLPCIPSPNRLQYRNKIQLPVDSGGDLGLYARNTHDFVPIERCDIHCPLGEKVFQEIRRILRTSSLKKEIKHVLIKTAVHSKEVLVVLVTKTHTDLDILAQAILKSSEYIRGVVQNIHPDESNVILGKEWMTVAGQGWIEERLCDLYFKVSPASFFQVNPEQAEALYRKVLEVAQLRGTERVVDAYCGVGTLSLILARQAREVIGIECVQEAIVDAIDNARRNHIQNVQFLCSRAEKKLQDLGPLDVAVLNPPRKGCERLLLESLIKAKPLRIVYISCDPATLARDVSILVQGGYRLQPVQPFDMFPQTMHVESVAILEWGIQ